MEPDAGPLCRPSPPRKRDEDFDFAEARRSIHMDLKELNDEAAKLATRINRNFEQLGV